MVHGFSGREPVGVWRDHGSNVDHLRRSPIAEISFSVGLMLLSGHFCGARRVVRIDVVASPRDEVAISHAGYCAGSRAVDPASTCPPECPAITCR